MASNETQTDINRLVRELLPFKRSDPVRIGNVELIGRLPRGNSKSDLFVGKYEGQLVALKRLEQQAGSGWTKRFKTEYETLQKVDSPRVANFVAAFTDQGHLCYLQQFIDGTPLSKLIENQGGGLPHKDIRAIAIGILWALDDIHRSGVTHRDVKPANIIIRPDRTVALVDFGIARNVEADGTFAPTQELPGIVGSPPYVAPERRTGRGEQSTAVDLFAWGVVVAEMAAGHLPWDRHEDWIDLVKQMQAEDGHLDAVPTALLPAVRSALAADPERRPTAAAAANTLERATVFQDKPTSQLVVLPSMQLADLRHPETFLRATRRLASDVALSIATNKGAYAVAIAGAVIAAFVTALVLIIILHILGV